MSPFERACHAWYAENIRPFEIHMGIALDSFKTLRLKGPTRAMFLKAMNLIMDKVETQPRQE